MMHAFTSTSTLFPTCVRDGGRRRARAAVCGARMACVQSADAMEFFAHRAGRWRSRRVTHHLAFRRAESGESEIEMEVLQAADERIEKLCELHSVDASFASGGCRVSWQATMAWDQEGENHSGETVFALVPDVDNIRAGRMLRDRGYAEIVPVVGRYQLNDDDELMLNTPYEGGAVEETFAFDGPDLCNRVSNVKRFGGIATATFSTESRIGVPSPGDNEEDIDAAQKELDNLFEHMLFGAPPSAAVGPKPLTNDFLSASRARFANVAAQRNKNGAPSTTSAFGTGFSSAGVSPDAKTALGSGTSSSPATLAPTTSNEGNGAAPEDLVAAAAARAGIDLSKVPPSMREEFLKSLEKESTGGSQ